MNSSPGSLALCILGGGGGGVWPMRSSGKNLLVVLLIPGSLLSAPPHVGCVVSPEFTSFHSSPLL